MQWTRIAKYASLVLGGSAVYKTYHMVQTRSMQPPPTEEEKAFSQLAKEGDFYFARELKLPKQVFKKFRLRNDDVFVVSFPKSGTTWMQEMVYQILHGFNPSASGKTIEDRSPFLEYFHPGLQAIDKMPSPRIIKTHIPWSRLPADIRKRAKIIYMARNPRDVSVSLYWFFRIFKLKEYNGRFPDFVRMFSKGKVPYGPWENHVEEFWNERDNSNVLFLTYEQLSQDPVGVAKRVATFLDRPIGNEVAEQISNHCSFDKMRNNPLANYEWWEGTGLKRTGGKFMRNGKVGDWSRHFGEDEDLLELMVGLERKLAKQGLFFTCTLSDDGQSEKGTQTEQHHHIQSDSRNVTGVLSDRQVEAMSQKDVT